MCGASSPPDSNFARSKEDLTYCVISPSDVICIPPVCRFPTNQYISTGSLIQADLILFSFREVDNFVCLCSNSETGTLQSSPSGPDNPSVLHIACPRVGDPKGFAYYCCFS